MKGAVEAMKSEQLVTIITPCFNSEKTISYTIESVLGQTYSNMEYLIIDGASTDKTVEIAKSYKETFDDSKAFRGRMKIISEPDEGIYYAMNKGIRMAKGELIGIINSDDYYEKDAVSIMIEHRTQNPYQILYGFERIMRNGKEVSICIHHHTNLDHQMITHPTCFVTKRLYADFGIFNTDYKYSADYEFMLRVYHSGKVEFTPVYELISNYALGGASSSKAAYMETQQLYYQYGVITRKRYLLLRWKYWVSKLII